MADTDRFKGKTITVGVLEDDDDMRSWLCAIISDTKDFALAFAAGSLGEAARMLETAAPDVCLVDIQLPDGCGLNFSVMAKARTAAKVLILSVLGDRKSVLDALDVGADGYLTKDTPAEQIRRDIRQVAAGEAPISPRAAAHLLRSYRGVVAADGASLPSISSPLTERETDVLRLFAKGLSYNETAAALSVSKNTVGAHVKSIYAKLDVSSRNRAVFEAGQRGLIGGEPGG